jgi:hypothetical protein
MSSPPAPKRFRINLMALTIEELHQLHLATASALESRGRGPHRNSAGHVCAQDLWVPVPDVALKLG